MLFKNSAMEKLDFRIYFKNTDFKYSFHVRKVLKLKVQCSPSQYI